MTGGLVTMLWGVGNQYNQPGQHRGAGEVPMNRVFSIVLVVLACFVLAGASAADAQERVGPTGSPSVSIARWESMVERWTTRGPAAATLEVGRRGQEEDRRPRRK